MKYLIFILTILLSMNLSGQSLKINLDKALVDGGKVYGSYCGFAGTHPPTRIIVEELIADEDLETLSSWLTSPNLVIQTYAAEAFMRLASSDLIFSETDLALVEEIKLKKDKISTCTGCVYQGLTIAECLEKIEPENERVINKSRY